VFARFEGGSTRLNMGLPARRKGPPNEDASEANPNMALKNGKQTGRFTGRLSFFAPDCGRMAPNYENAFTMDAFGSLCYNC
jgi:hypothetical protein